MENRHLNLFLTAWVGKSSNGAALVDRLGRTVAIAGAITEEEATQFATLVMYRLQCHDFASRDFASRMFAREIVSLELNERNVALGMVTESSILSGLLGRRPSAQKPERQLFVVAVLSVVTPEALADVRFLRDQVAWILRGNRGDVAPAWPGDTGSGSTGSGSSGSGPAELPLVEYGVTVGRKRGKD